jgi:hypothetical protein
MQTSKICHMITGAMLLTSDLIGVSVFSPAVFFASCVISLTIPLRRGVLDTTLCYNFVSDLRQVGGFLQALRFPPPIKLTATI